MKILLDTHVFIWLEEDSSRLSPYGRVLVNSPTVELFLSYVSIWEMQIKLAINKLESKVSLKQRILLVQSTNHVQLLPIELPHVYLLSDLPHHHRDPFDRLLIAQALHEGMPLLTKDAKFHQYPIETVW